MVGILCAISLALGGCAGRYFHDAGPPPLIRHEVESLPFSECQAADAPHIKLVEGENLADVTPLLDWIGKVKIRVLEDEHSRQ